jgi:hypothetical protein
VEEKMPMLDGQVARQDPTAVSARSDQPAFLAPPVGAPVYHGFLLLPNSEKDGFVFGAITRPHVGASASWGDAYVVAPDGSRAGIVWATNGPLIELVLPPEPRRWGVYQFRFEQPVESDAELIRNLHAILPRLKELYAAAKLTRVSDDLGNTDGST